MALFNANLLIRETRLAKGLTQEKLAEGICSRETIVKLEKGERKPNWFVFNEIMNRLGLESYVQQDDIGSADDVVIRQTIEYLLSMLGISNEDELKAGIDKIEAEIQQNTNLGKLWSSGVGYKYFLQIKSSLLCQGKYKDPKSAVQLAMECLKLTRPNFEIDKIPEYFLAMHEMITINTLASAYFELEGAVKSVEIIQSLKQNMEKNYFATTDIRHDKRYKVLLGNLILDLSYTEQHDKCLQLSEEALELAKVTSDLRLYSMCLEGAAYSLTKLGRKCEGEALYKKFMLFAFVLDGYQNLDFAFIKKSYEEEFNKKLDLSVEW